MASEQLGAEISRHIWETRYRHRDDGDVHDVTIADTWRRVARAVAAVEAEPGAWEPRFVDLLSGFRFLPGGRILAGAGTGRRVTLFNCFVMGLIGDSMDGIFEALKQGALTMQQGGGVGYDFSTLRPSGTAAFSAGTIASGPVSFMRIWDAMCGTVLSTGSRRGAMMATMRCDHPDIEAFVDAKKDARELRRFNVSVLASDAFMDAVERDESWPLVFPVDGDEDVPSDAEVVRRAWSGRPQPVACRVHRRVPARELWQRIMRATYDYAEPGVLFVDRINEQNNLAWRERISATNPCGEIPLPPYGACNLGSVNLPRFVDAPFSTGARFDMDGFRAIVRTAVRFMDDVIDASRFPLEEQAEQARGTRRVGLGVTGLADALIMLGLAYGDRASLAFVETVMRALRDAAYEASIEVAREKGPFPFFDKERYLESPFVAALPRPLQDAIADHGVRNSHLVAIAPTGTISLLAENVSSSLEPVFAFEHARWILEADGTRREHRVTDYAWRLWNNAGRPDAVPPEAFVTATRLEPETHLAVQAAAQPFVDNAISKTINVPADYPFEAFRSLYERAYRLGCKGCTTFRPNDVTGDVLVPIDGVTRSSHCCSIDREDA